MGFVSWAMTCYNGCSFALCGKTVTSLRRNLVEPLLGTLGAMGFTYIEKLSKSYIDIEMSGRRNRFYFFGGRDESSASLIQGITLGGVLLDEVALMPRSLLNRLWQDVPLQVQSNGSTAIPITLITGSTGNG